MAERGKDDVRSEGPRDCSGIRSVARDDVDNIPGCLRLQPDKVIAFGKRDNV